MKRNKYLIGEFKKPEYIEDLSFISKIDLLNDDTFHHIAGVIVYKEKDDEKEMKRILAELQKQRDIQIERHEYINTWQQQTTAEKVMRVVLIICFFATLLNVVFSVASLLVKIPMIAFMCWVFPKVYIKEEKDNGYK